MKCASWALDHQVAVVISNGKVDKGILNIIEGNKVGTFFSPLPHETVPIDLQAMKGSLKRKKKENN